MSWVYISIHFSHFAFWFLLFCNCCFLFFIVLYEFMAHLLNKFDGLLKLVFDDIGFWVLDSLFVCLISCNSCYGDYYMNFMCFLFAFLFENFSDVFWASDILFYFIFSQFI